MDNWHAEAKIETNSEEIRLTARDGSVCVMRWDKLVKISVYKLDLFTIDEIRLVFVADSCGPIQISGEHQGFPQLFAALQERIPGFLDSWGRVMQPAFARNETTLFPKSET